MSTYEIIPETDAPGHNILSQASSISDCRKMCNDTPQCEAFVWIPNNNIGTCYLKSEALDTSYKANSTLYIKKENSSYWPLWLFLVLIGLVLFYSKCRTCNR